jgi:hypothetical protein
MNIITNWSKAKKGIVTFFKGITSKAKTEKITSKQISIDPIEEEKKKLGHGRAFKNNRKTTHGRRSQYIPIGKDSMGNVHHKLICHSC